MNRVVVNRERPWRRKRAREKPADDLETRMVVGLQPAREAVRALGSKIRQVYVLKGNLRCERFADFARDNQVSTISAVSQAELDRLTHNAHHQGIALVAPRLILSDWDQVAASPQLLAIALDKVSDPQNFGAIIRSAVGMAGASVLWGEHSSAPLTPATFRASAGAVERATLCQVRSLHEALQRAQALGAQVVGLDAQAAPLLSSVDLVPPTVIVLGSEDRGLSRAVRQNCTTLARLPMSGNIASLNVSAAAAVALYEACAQRQRSA